jgi:hypothetical protein
MVLARAMAQDCQISGGKIIGPAGTPRSDWSAWRELSLGAYSVGIQMKHFGEL